MTDDDFEDFDLDDPDEGNTGTLLPSRQRDSLVSTNRMKGNYSPMALKEEDLQDIPHPVLRKVTAHEMQAIDLYLANIHKGFTMAVTVGSVINLVNSALNIHKHKRELLMQVSNLTADKEDDDLEYDSLGRLIVKSKK